MVYLKHVIKKEYKKRKEALWGFLKLKGLRITLLLLKLDYLFLSLLKKIKKKQENLFRRCIKRLNSKTRSGEAKAEWQNLKPHARSQSSVWPISPPTSLGCGFLIYKMNRFWQVMSIFPLSSEL